MGRCYIIERLDGFYNAFIGHGKKNLDPYSLFGFKNYPLLTDKILVDLFMGNSIAKKIINLSADEAVKNWIGVTNDEEELVVQMLDDLGAEKHFANALRWSRLFGGSAILLIIDDGGTFEDELNIKNIRLVEKLKVYDKRQIFWNNAVLYDDLNSRKYGEPAYYQITPVNGIPFMVHESRLLLFKGEDLPEYESVKFNYWGLSALQGLWDEIRNNAHSHELAIKIMERMSQSILKLKGLLEKLEIAGGDELVQKRLELIDMARSIMNTIAIDTEDEFDYKTVNMANIPEMLDRFGLAVSAASGIPFTLLFGRSPAGQNATGQSDLENYYNMVRQIQKRQLKKPLDKLVKLLMLSKDGLFHGRELPKWAIKFNPLWLPSAKEQAETDKMQAETKEKIANIRRTYMDSGALDASEVRQKLKEEGEYQIDDSLEMSGEIDYENNS